MKKGLFIVALAATVSVLSSTAFSQDLSNNPAYKNGTEWLANPVANPDAEACPRGRRACCRPPSPPGAAFPSRWL